MLREFRAEGEEYWKRKQEESEEMKAEGELQEKLKILHTFKAERENNKLRPKVHRKEPLDPPPQTIPRKRSRSPDTKSRAQFKSTEQKTGAKEPKGTLRLITVCRIVKAKQRELDETMAQVYRLQEELMKLSAEVENISFEVYTHI